MNPKHHRLLGPFEYNLEVSIFFSRPSDIPKLPIPVESYSGLPEVANISPEFLSSLPKTGGGAEFTSRNRLHLLVTEPAEVSSVLIANADHYLKGEQEIALSKAIGWGLIGLEGDAHKQAQKTASPALRAESLSSYVSTIKQVAQKHLDNLQSGQIVPMRHALRCLSQDAAERSLFSGKEEFVDYSYQDHVFNLNTALFGAEVQGSSTQAALQLTQSYSVSRHGIMNHVSKLIKSWEADTSTGTFLIDYLSSGKEIGDGSFDQFHQQVSVFLQAATETTASLASWTIMLLSDYPEYWLKLQDEVVGAGSLETYDAIVNLRFLDAVINESLRLYPPAWFIPRIARVDTAVGGRKVKAGTRVVTSPYVSHRTEEFFEQPNTFFPERWLTEADSLPRGLFYPFGMGNRICIGERYGKITAKIIILSALERGHALRANHSRVEIDNYALLLNPSPKVQFGLAKLPLK